MNSFILGRIRTILSSSLLLTLALTGVAPAGAATQLAVAAPAAGQPDTTRPGTAEPNSYRCWEFATWKTSLGATGVNPLLPPMAGPMSSYSGTAAGGGGVPVSGATIEIAASKCHADTRAHFKSDAMWAMSNYNALCSKTFKPGQSGTITVWAIDRFKEIAQSPQRYNKVAGYVVTCGNSVTPDDSLQGGILPF